MNMNNIDIRIAIMEAGLTHCEVAQNMGVTPEWFSRILRFAISNDKKQEIYNAIQSAKDNKVLNGRRKGKNGEIELVNKLKQYGYDCHRAQGMYQNGGIDTPDVAGLPGIHIECKRVEKLNLDDAYEQAVEDAEGKAIPAVFHRKNRTGWKVTLSLDDFMRIYKYGEEHFKSSL